MRSLGPDALPIVEGGGKGRLSKIKTSGDSGQLTSLQEGYPDGGVSVAVLGRTACVLEGQLSAIFGSPNQTRRKTISCHRR